MVRPVFNAVAHGVRSGLEEKVSEQLQELGIDYEYETRRITYEIPASLHKYTPDFILPNGIIVETKGRFLSDDRKKHLLIQDQHPDLDIRFVFSSVRTKISTGAKSTVAEWCEKHGFVYAQRLIPQAWLEEKPSPYRLEALHKSTIRVG